MESHAFLISSFIISEAIIICSYYCQENDGNDSFIIFLLIDLDMTDPMTNVTRPHFTDEGPVLICLMVFLKSEN